jgi:hypothetical protein
VPRSTKTRARRRGLTAHDAVHMYVEMTTSRTPSRTLGT